MKEELFIMLVRSKGSQGKPKAHLDTVPYTPGMPRCKLLLQTVVCVAIALLVTSASAEDPVEHQFQEMLARAGAATGPGVAVLVRQDGKVLIKVGHGVQDLRSRAQIGARTNFRLASCTKQFTALAIMLLVHDGKLRYDERLTEVFPEFPLYGNAITILHLLNHTSGLPDYEDLMDKASAGKPALWTESHQITDSEVLKLLEVGKSSRFPPGTHWSYSNSGYVVLGLIAAKVSGQSFPEFLRERILKPLGMNHSVAYLKGANEVRERAYGHSLVNGAIVETDQSSTSATLGDGGIYSNLDDLAKWDEALTHHTLLSEQEMQAALSPMRLPDGSLPTWDSGPGDTDPLVAKDVSYGFGWFLDPYKGHPRMWHYGETIGFKSSIHRFTKDNLTVIVLTNRSDVDAIGLATNVADMYLK
jgi:CubicO group peptidase (beta-lactamase class C family)